MFLGEATVVVLPIIAQTPREAGDVCCVVEEYVYRETLYLGCPVTDPHRTLPSLARWCTVHLPQARHIFQYRGLIVFPVHTNHQPRGSETAQYTVVHVCALETLT